MSHHYPILTLKVIQQNRKKKNSVFTGHATCLPILAGTGTWASEQCAQQISFPAARQHLGSRHLLTLKAFASQWVGARLGPGTCYQARYLRSVVLGR